MKKIILTLAIIISAAVLLNANTLTVVPFNPIPIAENVIPDAVDPPDCWAIADEEEEMYCGYVGCSFFFWEQAYCACDPWQCD